MAILIVRVRRSHGNLATPSDPSGSLNWAHLDNVSARPGSVSASDKLGIYLQLYNLKVDEATHKTQVSVAYRITQDKEPKEVWRAVGSADHLHQGGEQLTIERLIPVNTLAPGRYTIEVTAIDLLTNETVTRSTEFTVKPAPAKALVPLRPSLY